VDNLESLEKKKIELAKTVIEKDGKYLLLFRHPNYKVYPGLWDFPGGKLEPGETPTEAVIRETKEETSFDIVPGTEVKESLYEDHDYFLLFHYFVPERMGGELKISDAHSDYGWFTKEEIASLKTHSSVSSYFKT
jgi:mutator protein MutT